MDVVGVMPAYSPVVRVCVLHSLEECLSRLCSTQTRTTGKYAAITQTTFISTDKIEPLL